MIAGICLLTFLGAGTAHVDVLGHAAGILFGATMGWLCAQARIPKLRRTPANCYWRRRRIAGVCSVAAGSAAMVWPPGARTGGGPAESGESAGNKSRVAAPSRVHRWVPGCPARSCPARELMAINRDQSAGSERSRPDRRIDAGAADADRDKALIAARADFQGLYYGHDAGEKLQHLPRRGTQKALGLKLHSDDDSYHAHEYNPERSQDNDREKTQARGTWFLGSSRELALAGKWFWDSSSSVFDGRSKSARSSVRATTLELKGKYQIDRGHRVELFERAGRIGVIRDPWQ